MEIGIGKTVKILEQVHQSESTPKLKNEACRSKFFIYPYSTSKVCLFLHGFTAGPYQFEPLGKAFFNRGYNVLIPLQPGHGLSGNWNRQNPPPLPTDIQIYQQFVLKWLQIAKTLGQQVVVGGLSTGGTLAAWLALEHPQEIERALLFAPFLGSRYLLFDWLLEILPIYFEWFNKDAPGNFGYKGFRLQALQIFLKLAQKISKQSQTCVSAPTLMVCSEADRAVSRSKQQDFFKTIVKQQPKSWYYCFDDSLHIEHRMMTKLEDNDYEELVIILAKAFVDSDLTWVQFQQMAKRVAQGEVYENIKRELNLDSQASQQLSAMMTQHFGCQHLECINPSK
ncbi:alpha/beta fold hydrolase [Nostocaceae cyanobacterium CENA369]|uniref:Alpha/beta fold hydrolase n=2 Tax=Dendronalium phyllosphericum CENA369 TaxID=1725256 RepID=A0A8J7I4S2_9NOST|nr:alpha/beta fold hydrolase [Dendronalium phyllosphericum]MBH8575880.1 alpha/beta fold hydrolase [Dendronalium phyllosphericum CENA369]